MNKSRNAFRKRLFLSVATSAILAIPIALSPAHAKSIRAQSQPPTFNLSDFKFDVASVWSAKNPAGGWYFTDTEDGVTGFNVPLVNLVHSARGIYRRLPLFRALRLDPALKSTMWKQRWKAPLRKHFGNFLALNALRRCNTCFSFFSLIDSNCKTHCRHKRSTCLFSGHRKEWPEISRIKTKSR